MSNNNLFNEAITSFNVEVNDSTDAIKSLGKILETNNYIKESYTDSVVEREKGFPTGLVLANAGIAIPHATPNDNVLKNGIAAAHLKKPVNFACMEDPDKEIPVNMIFMLALSSNQHLEILKKLFIVFQNQDLVTALLNSKDKVEFLNLLTSNVK